MNRRSFIKNTTLALGALTITQQKVLSAIVEEPWKIKMLRNDVGLFTEKGGTIVFLLSKKGIVVVDSQFPEQSQHLINELRKQSEHPFRFLINTHHHGDHTAGNVSFKGIVEHVVAHENSLKNQKNAAAKAKSEDKQLYPDKIYTDSWSEKVGDEKINLLYYGAGHTNGDSFVHFENSNIVHCGDLVFNRKHPYVDRSAGANIKSWMQVLNKAVHQFDKETICVFGHSGNDYGVTGTTEDLKKFNDYLEKLLSFVEREIKSGKTKEEVLKTEKILGAEEWKGEGIQRPLLAAYEELTT